MVATVEHKGHWLTFTTPKPAEEVCEVMGGGFSEWQPLRAYGQPGRVIHESGASVHYGSPREDQPTVVNLTGSVCEEWFDEGIAWAEKSQGKVTRVDLAADVGPDDQARRRLIEMVTAWKRGRVQTRMRIDSHHLVKSDRPGEGWTAYFGGQHSALMMRAYDMRGPLRIEQQWRPPGDAALYIPLLVKAQGVATVWRSLAATAIWPMSWYQELLDGVTVELEKEQETETMLLQMIEALRTQMGGNLWALEQLGYTLGDLARDPGKDLRGDVAAKYLRWSREAPKLGYDGSKLRREVQCRLKSKR